MLDVIVTSLVQPEVSIPSKLARLYLQFSMSAGLDQAQQYSQKAFPKAD